MPSFHKPITGFFLAITLASCHTFSTDNFFKFGPDDAEINVSVQEKIMKNPDLAPYPLHIETAKGVVYLSGYVKTIKQSDIAESLANHIYGVKHVENNIIVRK